MNQKQKKEILDAMVCVSPWGNSRECNDPWDLMGNHNSTQRQRVMLAITGRKIPKAKCGVNAIKAALVEAFEFPHGLASCEFPDLIKAERAKLV